MPSCSTSTWLRRLASSGILAFSTIVKGNTSSLEANQFVSRLFVRATRLTSIGRMLMPSDHTAVHYGGTVKYKTSSPASILTSKVLP